MFLVLLTWLFYDFMTWLDLTFVSTFYHFFTFTVTQCPGLQHPAQVHGWGQRPWGLQPQPPPSWQSAVASSSCAWWPVSERPRDGSSWKVAVTIFLFRMLESSYYNPSHADPDPNWIRFQFHQWTRTKYQKQHRILKNLKMLCLSAHCFWKTVALRYK